MAGTRGGTHGGAGMTTTYDVRSAGITNVRTGVSGRLACCLIMWDMTCGGIPRGCLCTVYGRCTDCVREVPLWR